MLKTMFLFIIFVVIGLSLGTGSILAQPPGEINAKMPISFAQIRYPAPQNEQAVVD
jgi:hypothetical protein